MRKIKALVRTKPGKNLSTMVLKEVDTEPLLENDVRVKMAASRINPIDYELMKGIPGIKYKKIQVGGVDGSGTIIEVGSNVSNFKIGDEVFFYTNITHAGSWAEEFVIDAKKIAAIPSNISIKDAGSIALNILTAYDMLVQMNPTAGKKMLIHGAGGGVGFQTLQLAKQMNLNVTVTASKKDFDILKKAGADRCIDYKNDNFYTELKNETIDYVIDLVGTKILKDSFKLKPTKVTSVKYMDITQMEKTGLKLPKIISFLIKLSMKKYTSPAKRYKVALQGQVTDSDGELLKKTVAMVNKMNYIIKPYTVIPIKELEGRQLTKDDLGKIILF